MVSTDEKLDINSIRVQLHAALNSIDNCREREAILAEELRATQAKRHRYEKSVAGIMTSCESAIIDNPATWRQLLHGIHSRIAKALASASLHGGS